MDLDAIFKAYDVRGTVPAELDSEAARRIGAAFASFTGAPEIAVGRDCRESSPELAAAFIAGATSVGTDVRDLGMIATDMVYFASGHLDMPGAMITASHNPKGYNGIKLCLAGAAPVGAETGLAEIRAGASSPPGPERGGGVVRETAILGDYLDHMLGVVDPKAIGPLRVAVDGGNGVVGVAVPGLFDRLDASLTGLFLDPDGTFPNHHPDPLRPENLADLEALMRAESFDVGFAFDGDADRAFVIDDEVRPLPGSTATAIIARWYLDKNPGSAVVYNLICSRAVPEIIAASGGIPVRTRVGHSYIKAVMADSDAVFGGEHSGHYYFRDNYRADSGILAMLVLLRVLSEDGRRLSVLRRDYEPYVQSGEINFRVPDPGAVIEAIAVAYRDAPQDRLDGLTVDLGESWFNLRPSNTEPVLRLNAEAGSAEDVAALVGTVERKIERAS